MNIYLAARYSRKHEVSDRARELAALGVCVTSRWHDKPTEPYPRDPAARDPRMTSAAEEDLFDIRRADALLAFTDQGLILGGGHHWEAGYACALGKRLYVLGPRQTVFYHLADVRQYYSWEDLKRDLAVQASVV